MNNLKYIRDYFADPVHQQCVNQHEVENLAGVDHEIIQTALTVDDAVSEEDLKAVVAVLKML